MLRCFIASRNELRLLGADWLQHHSRIEKNEPVQSSSNARIVLKSCRIELESSANRNCDIISRIESSSNRNWDNPSSSIMETLLRIIKFHSVNRAILAQTIGTCTIDNSRKLCVLSDIRREAVVGSRSTCSTCKSEVLSRKAAENCSLRQVSRTTMQ